MKNIFGILFLIFALVFLFRVRNIDTAAAEIAYALLAFLYIPLLLLHLVFLQRALGQRARDMDARPSTRMA